jgi:hypothetical protein
MEMVTVNNKYSGTLCCSIMSLFNLNVKKKPPGRPFLHKKDPNITHMRITAELKAILESEIQGRETMAECCLRLLRTKGKKVAALLQERDYLNQHVDQLQKRIDRLLQVQRVEEYTRRGGRDSG